MLDYEKTRDWVVENIRSTQEALTEKGLTFTQERHLEGAVKALATFLNALELGELNAEKTPIEDITVPVRTAVRSKDPSTSWAAALEAVSTNKRRSLYVRIMAGLRGMGPATDEMLEDYFRTVWRHHSFSPSGIRSRRAELVRAGWVKAVGKKKLRNGNLATTWAPTD